MTNSDLLDMPYFLTEGDDLDDNELEEGFFLLYWTIYFLAAPFYILSMF